jgi:signal transduction histidine kinase
VSTPTERPRWPTHDRWIDVGWVLFSIANLFAILLIPSWETVPFHFIWVSLTLLYGFRVWRLRPTVGVLAAVVTSTAVLIWIDVRGGAQSPDELTEVPLMAAMFIVMVWHARRRLAAAEEIERISDANARLLAAENRFVQDASHELRTPITVALGHVELIQRAAVDPTIREDVGVIADELMRLRRVADRLLLLAGTEDPDFLSLRPVDLEAIVTEAVRRWTTTPRRWRLAGAEESIAVVDPERFAVALDALIENAVNHTSEEDTIEVGVHRSNDRVVLSVRDSGTGIPAADLDRIFERFARADPGRSRHTGGAGLGLSIVTAIAKAHGGSVSVESTEGAGTTFEISIPAAFVATNGAGSPNEDGQARSGDEGSPSADGDPLMPETAVHPPAR